jgi:hypothetical protein
VPNAVKKDSALWESKLYYYPRLVEPHDLAVAEISLGEIIRSRLLR